MPQKENKKIALHNISAGFTLVELLVAISILSIAILATFTAISNNFRSSNFSTDQISAYYLADEGIEFIRNMRDENSIKNTYALASSGSTVSWLNGIAGSSSDPCYGKVCTVDSPHKTLSSCSGTATTCPYLQVDPVTGLYGYLPSWAQTPFRRSVVVTINSATEAVVTVTVSWTTNNVSKTYSLSEVLENWQ